jgi:hypothetical protein
MSVPRNGFRHTKGLARHPAKEVTGATGDAVSPCVRAAFRPDTEIDIWRATRLMLKALRQAGAR